MKVYANNLRVAWPNLFEPTNMRGETDPKKRTYNIVAIVPPKHECVDLLDAAMLAVCEEKWPDTATSKGRGRKMLDQLLKEDKVFFFKKENTNAEGEPYAGFEGQWFLRARASYKNPPSIRDKNTAVIAEDNGRIYSGCYCNLVLDVWAQDNAKGFGNRVNCTLTGVQFVRDGDSFGGSKPATDDDFTDLSETGEGADFHDLT